MMKLSEVILCLVVAFASIMAMWFLNTITSNQKHANRALIMFDLGHALFRNQTQCIEEICRSNGVTICDSALIGTIDQAPMLMSRIQKYSGFTDQELATMTWKAVRLSGIDALFLLGSSSMGDYVYPYVSENANDLRYLSVKNQKA